jgi:hypothetical protein
MPERMPFHVRCDSCGKSAETHDGSRLDQAVRCDCCPLDHDHSDCDRTVTITAFAHLSGEAA